MVGIEPKVVEVVRVKGVQPSPPPPPAPLPTISDAIRVVSSYPGPLAEAIHAACPRIASSPETWAAPLAAMSRATALPDPGTHNPPPSEAGTAATAPLVAEKAGRRPVSAWTEALEELRRALVSGAVYDRELDELSASVSSMLDAMTRRIHRR